MEAINLVASLAEEVHVQVFVFLVVVALAHAQLIPYSAVAILYGVHEMMFAKQGQGAEYAALVHAHQMRLKLCQR